MKIALLVMLILAGLALMISSTDGGDKKKEEEKVITTKSGLKYVELKAGRRQGGRQGGHRLRPLHRHPRPTAVVRQGRRTVAMNPAAARGG